MIRTRHFEVRNERIETGVLVKSHKGKNVSAERRMVSCYLYEAKWIVLTVENKMDSVQKRFFKFPRQSAWKNSTIVVSIRKETSTTVQELLQGNCTDTGPSGNYWLRPVCQT